MITFIATYYAVIKQEILLAKLTRKVENASVAVGHFLASHYESLIWKVWTHPTVFNQPKSKVSSFQTAQK